MIRDERMTVGRRHEAAVADRLRSFGWHVEPFGVERFDRTVLSVLLRSPLKRMIRWVPDLIAARDDTMKFVESKGALTNDTANHSIEIDCLAALLMTEVVWDIPVVIVWADFTVNRPSFIRPVNWILEPDTWRTDGSNKPFALVSKAEQHPFELAFGKTQ